MKQAIQKKLLTDDEVQNSLPTSKTVVKCYLRSVVTDKCVLQRIETYVQYSSLLYSRGSFIANLLAVDTFGAVQNDSCMIKDYNANFMRTESDELFDFVEQNDFKQVFLPERWPAHKKPLDSRIESVRDHYRNELERFYPSTWKTFMSVSGWDNALNSMNIKYRANIEVQVKCHMMRYLEKYLGKVATHGIIPEGDENTKNMYSRALKSMLHCPLRPTHAHVDDFEKVMALRAFLGIKIDEYAPRECEYNRDTFHMFMFLVNQGITGSSYLPISTIGRKYAYIDNKVATYLVPSIYKQQRDVKLAEAFGLTPSAFKSRRKRLRQQLRRKYSRSDDRSKKLKKKWMKIGCSNMPADAMVFSFQTDGVGMSICVQRPQYNVLNDPPQKKKLNKADQQALRMSTIEAVPHDSVFVGVDPGRAKAFTAAVADNPLKPPKTIMLTRGEYYYRIKHSHRTVYEQARSSLPDVAAALDALSQTSKSDFPAYFKAVSVHANTLINEYLNNVERPLWRMRLYRLKRQTLDRSVNKIFAIARKRPVCIGIGNSSIASTGKGERAMPTCKIVKTILRMKSRHNNEVHIRSIDEFRTTVCCCACGCPTASPIITGQDGSTRPSRRLRLCTTCDKTAGRRRDRDVQAARNMLWLTQHEVLGKDCRPWYMSRHKK